MTGAERLALLAKIKAVLALSRSANEHEAAAALSKARALMERYGVDEAEVSLADVGEHQARGSQRVRPPLWESMLSASVKRAIPVEVLIDADLCRSFVGIGSAPEIAAYAFTVLFRQLKGIRAQYISTKLKRCSATRKRQRADAFCEGWAGEVYYQIAKLNPEQSVDPIVRQYLAKRYEKLGTVKSRAAGVSGRVAEDDRANGRESGRAAQLHQGVGVRAEPLRIGARS